ncbi:MAG: Flavin reductase like domain protein [Daejeonella sp.]|nr:Flavin reductase like domain protein [Daejeonella sp.]
MLTLKTSDLSPVQIQNYLLHVIAPRPICFASTVDLEGNVNLSPFSYFNIFSVNPPVCIFSPARRVRGNTTKHTLENLHEVPECVINIVNYDIVQQTSLASTEYPKGVNEFLKAGLTELKSQLVKPPRVAEAPVQLECIVKQIIPLGNEAGAGNLVIAEIKLIHINEDILNEDGNIDQEKVDLVARLGGDWYCRVTKESLFKIAKPLAKLGIGVDALPAHVKNSFILTGNDLGQLGNVESLPSEEEVEEMMLDSDIRDLLNNTIGDPNTRTIALHTKAKELLVNGEVITAWKVLLI